MILSKLLLSFLLISNVIAADDRSQMLSVVDVKTLSALHSQVPAHASAASTAVVIHVAPRTELLPAPPPDLYISASDDHNKSFYSDLDVKEAYSPEAGGSPPHYLPSPSLAVVRAVPSESGAEEVVIPLAERLRLPKHASFSGGSRVHDRDQLLADVADLASFPAVFAVRASSVIPLPAPVGIPLANASVRQKCVNTVLTVVWGAGVIVEAVTYSVLKGENDSKSFENTYAYVTAVLGVYTLYVGYNWIKYFRS
jgi:hypothetical protein